jgi:DNA polymerase-3 subunit delta
MEDYLRDQAVAAIKAAVLGGAEEGGFNCDVLYGDETDASEVLAGAGEAPMFGERRLVVVKAADRLPARERDALLPYLEHPCDSTTLVFVAAKLDRRQRFTKALKERAVTVECSALPDHHLADWIRREAERSGVRLNEEAILLMKELAVSLKDLEGGALYMVRRELEKLAVYMPEGKEASPADVEAVRGGEPGASVFDLSEAIAARDRGRALRILARNLEAGEAPLRILGSLAWQYRRIWKAKDSVRQSGVETDHRLRRFSEPHLRGAFQLFAEADARLKGGSASRPARVMESLLFSLCDRSGGAGQWAPESTTVHAPQRGKAGGTKPITNVRTIRSGRPPSS